MDRYSDSGVGAIRLEILGSAASILCLGRNVIVFFYRLNKGYFEYNADRCFTNISGYEDNTLFGLDSS